jgi:hypothetical protein
MLDLIRTHPAFVKQRAQRHDEGYRRDLVYLHQHEALWRTLNF